MALELLKTPYELLLEEAGYPRMAGGGQPPTMQQARMAAAYGAAPQGINQIDPNWDNNQPIDLVKAYQPDPTNRFGSKTGMATVPHMFNKSEIQNYVKAMRAAEPLGVPQLTEQQLLAKLVAEGRSDFGSNVYDFNNKKAAKIHDTLMEMGFGPEYATFPAAIYTTDRLAKHHNVPFEHQWNGLGRSATTGKTGAQHNTKYEQYLPLVNHPLNADVSQVINEAYNYRPKDPSITAPFEYTDPMGNFVPTTPPNQRAPMFANGGAVKPKTFHDISKMLIQKHLSGK